MPLILLFPFAFAIFALYANETGLFDINFAFCLLAIVTSLLLATAVLQNATVENRAEERLTDAVKELNVAVADRELLLREIYHRVKNNLQQIIALLHMETAKLGDPAAKDAFLDTAVRVHALGTVHRLLLSAPSLSTLSTGAFFRELCANIATSFDADGKGIAIHVDADDVPVDIDAAIPLGMLVNELVTNALKHAFDGRSDGEVGVLFKVESGGGAQLTVTDNGNGFTGTAHGASRLDGSGQRIVESFVKQIRGVMSIEVYAGTTVAIRFPSGFEGRGGDV
jgi:two-component sensor histidine kinase